MIVARALEVTPARLLEINVPANDHPAWVAGSYELDAYVVKDRHIWVSAAAGNTAVPGAETVQPFKWVDQGAINRWRMFDKLIGDDWQVGTFTENPESIQLVFQAADVINAIGMVAVTATSIRVEVSVADEGVVYDNTVNTADFGVDDYYDYFFAPIERRDAFTFLDLPPYSNARIAITIDAPDAVARVGSLVFGYQEVIGECAAGTSAGFETFSSLEYDRWGSARLVKNDTRDVVDFDVRIDTDRTGYVRQRMRELHSVPSLYVGVAELEITIIVGVAGRFRVVLPGPAISESAIEVKSLQ